jgi:hypothetical protein
MPKNPGRTAYWVATFCRKLESEKSDDEDVSPPRIPVVDAPEEGPPRRELRSPDVDDVDDAAGDARLCSVVGTAEVICDSVDCTPAPVDVPAACATAAA